MSGAKRRITAGRVGRPHGLDGSFYVEVPDHPLPKGTELMVADRRRQVERRAGTDDRPLLRVSGVGSPEAARELRGTLLLVEEDLAPGEWLADDLVGCRVLGLGEVRRVVPAPSCELLELEDGTLVPLVADAVREVRLATGEIEVDLEFLGRAPEDAP